jgi:bifunctional enzyme CysN/CysC
VGAGLLRFSTAGSVDDGKSTLIGRLLLDSKQIFIDQLEAVEEASRRQGFDRTELALLTDGLRAEREQGITIDVAYRYFATPARTFIIADTPGHVQYTRNMVTGASTADLAIVLVDARKGLVEQSRRHASIASLLRIRHLVVAVNKMDLVGFSSERFDEIRGEFLAFAADLDLLGEPVFVPISALHGDNVVDRSERTPWYTGPSLLEHLEQVPVSDARSATGLRFPVQWVIRPQSDDHHDYRGYAGQVAGGIVRPGDEVVVLPSGQRTLVAAVETLDGPLPEAGPGRSVTVHLADDVDVSRGCLLAAPDDPPIVGDELVATVCWMAEQPLALRRPYALKHTTSTVRALVTGVLDELDVNTGARDAGATTLGLNALGRIALRTTAPLAYDPYARNRATGSFILIDEATNATVAAGMLQPASPA